MYIAKEYEKYIKEKGISLYSNRQQKIPAPQFIVFYNGNRKIGERMEHRLSDAYGTSSGEPALELKVLVININEGYNQKLMESCQILKEYAQYVSKVRTYKKTLKLNEAVEKAVEECIREGILREFLLANKAEVVAMSIFEYDREWEEEILRKEEFEAGKEMGKELGEKLGRKLGKEEERKNTAKERHCADSEKMRADSEKMRADNAEKELLPNIKGYNRLTAEEKIELQHPYIDTTLLVDEMINLNHDESGGVVKITEKSGKRKDRYSSLSYNYYVACQLEIKNSRKKRHSLSSSIGFMYRAPKIK